MTMLLINFAGTLACLVSTIHHICCFYLNFEGFAMTLPSKRHRLFFDMDSVKTNNSTVV